MNTASKLKQDLEYIDSLESFQGFTGDPHQVGALYFYKKLDCLVTLAYKVSHDFFKRPHLYTNLGADKSDKDEPFSSLIAKLHAQYGTDELFPSLEQRDRIYIPIFGEGANSIASETESDFPRLRDELISAAAAFAERVYNTGEDMLRERVKTTHRPFQEYLTGLYGASLKWSADFALPNIAENIAYMILRNEGVVSVFGIDTPPIKEWPYREDSNGDKLVEAISKQLIWSDQQDEGCITRERISNLQRAALRGTEAIKSIIDYKESSGNEALDLLIKRCYTWGAALLSLNASSNSNHSLPALNNTERMIHMGNTPLYRPVNQRR